MVDISFSYANLEFFLLIFIRVISFIYIAPFFSMSNTPARVKVALGFGVAMLLYGALPPQEALSYRTLLGYTVIVLKEILTGFLVGFAATLCSSIVNFAGHIVDMEIGLSMVSLLDPATKTSTSITGVFYQYVVMLLLIVTGMYQYLLRALADTFTLIPVNGAVFHTDSLLASMLQFMGEYIMIGFRICLPVFTVMLLLNAILGVLAKVAPQLNMFAVGIQLKILVGLGILFLTAQLLPGAADFIFTQMKKMIVAFVEGMM